MPTVYNPQKSELSYFEALRDQASHISPSIVIEDLENETDIGMMIKVQCEIDLSPENYEFIIDIGKFKSLAKKEVTDENRDEIIQEARKILNDILLSVESGKNNHSSINLPYDIKAALVKKLETVKSTQDLQDLLNDIAKVDDMNSKHPLMVAQYEIGKLLSADSCRRIVGRNEEELLGKGISNQKVKASVIRVSEGAGKIIKASKERYESDKKESIESGMIDSLSKSLDKINAETNEKILKLIDSRISEVNKKIESLKSSKTPRKELAGLEERKAKLFALEEIRQACESQLIKHKGQSKNIIIDFTAAIEQAKVKYPSLSSPERIKFEKGIQESRHGGFKETHFANLKKEVEKELELRNQKISKFKGSSFKAQKPSKSG